MARIRTIKPEFPQSESMGRVSRDARLTFIQMWTIADDSGRLRGNSRMLASLLFPYDDDAKDLIEPWLCELEREKCIQRYEVEGSTFIQINNWLIHQKIDKPSASKIPPFENPREDSRTFVGGSGSGSGSGRDQEGSTRESALKPTEAEHHANFELVKTSYPKFAGNQDWITTEVNCRNRISEGATWQQLIDGAKRYAAFCRAAKREGTTFVTSPAKFFSDVTEPWKQAWELPSEPANAPVNQPYAKARPFPKPDPNKVCVPRPRNLQS